MPRDENRQDANIHQKIGRERQERHKMMIATNFIIRPE